VKRACSIGGCCGPAYARGWCRNHHQSWLRHGDPLAARPARKRSLPQPCGFEGCSDPVRAYGLCFTHYCRWRKHGDPRIVHPPGEPPGPDHSQRRPDWATSYAAAHRRVYRLRGPAVSKACQRCGAPAKHWAYDHSDPDERRNDQGLAYSLDPARYRPLCRPCHVHDDARHRILAELWTEIRSGDELAAMVRSFQEIAGGSSEA